MIGDGLAQWELGKIDKALAALQTSMGKIESARAIWIDTRADNPPGRPRVYCRGTQRDRAGCRGFSF